MPRKLTPELPIGQIVTGPTTASVPLPEKAGTQKSDDLNNLEIADRMSKFLVEKKLD